MGSSRPRVRCSRINSIFPKGLIVEATLRSPSIWSIFCTSLPSLAAYRALCLYGQIIASSNLVDDFRGIDHSDLLVPLGKISFSLLLSVLLKLLFNLLFILFMLVLANIVFDQFVNSLLVLGCQSLVTESLSLNFLQCLDIKVVFLSTCSSHAWLCHSGSCKLLLIRSWLALRMILSLLNWFRSIRCHSYTFGSSSYVRAGLGYLRFSSWRQVV